jgi:hypothetical protein
MADYYTNFSLVFNLPSAAALKYALALEADVQRLKQDEAPIDGVPEDIQACASEGDWSFETEADQSTGKWGLWLHSEYGGIDAVCVFIQHLLQKFKPKGRVAFEWSNDCSKPRLDAFGGGAAIVTADDIKSISTSQWIDQQLNG